MATDTQGGTGPAAVSSTEILEGLNDLLQLDHDAIGAYEIAIERLEDRDHASQIGGFLLDHQRHIRELNEMIQSLGGTPINEPHATGPFKQAMQSLGALGGDTGILVAWRANELQARTKYESYASKAVFWPNEVKRLIDQNALDEERHYHWVADVLQRMGVGPAGDAETHLVNRAREQVGRARGQVSAAMDSARERAATGLESAADRLDEMASQQAAAGGSRAKVAGTAHRVADGLEGTAELLRSGDTAQLREGLEEQVRTSPLRTLLTTFAVGFIIGRILR